MIEYLITDAGSRYADDRVRAWTLWEGGHGYDVESYAGLLRKAFQPLEHFALPQGGLPASVSPTARGPATPRRHLPRFRLTFTLPFL